MSKNIVITPGDGIGKEVTVQARKVMEYMAKRFQLMLEFTEVPIGGTAYDLTGTPLPDETLHACEAADAILLGAVGGPQWEALDYSVREHYSDYEENCSFMLTYDQLKSMENWLEHLH